MLLSFKWFRLRHPSIQDDLRKVLLSHEYSNENEGGFSCTQSESLLSNLRFTWNSEVLVPNMDDNGIPSFSKIQSIKYIDLNILRRGNTTYIRLENPGRSVKHLFNSLESICGFGFSSKQMIFDQSLSLPILQNLEIKKLIKAKLVDATIQRGVLAKIELASQNNIILDQIESLLGISYKLESASYEVQYNGVRGNLSYSSSGLVKIGGKLTPWLVNLVEDQLLEH